MAMTESPRRRTGRYIALLVLVAALCGGWTVLWFYAAGRAEATLEEWRVREAASGRVYACGSESIGGYPFRIEVTCDQASAQFRNDQLPIDLKAGGLLVAAQIYDPSLLIGEFRGPLTVAATDRTPPVIVNWKLFQSSVRGTPSAPERVSLVLSKPVIERVVGGNQQIWLRAEHAEIHGRIAEGSVASNPVVELALQLAAASAEAIHPGAATPIDADITAVLRGLTDFSPKPWAERFREIQAAGGRIDISQARLRQGESLAVGGGSLSLDASGRLQGQLRVTIAGLEPLLKTIGAEQMVQASPHMDKLAGALDRFAPGLGKMARQQVGANISTGINMLGEQTTLEGNRAVALPLRFEDGVAMLGPIRIGEVPPLF